MYQFYPQLILRTPAYSFDSYREAECQGLLAEPYFKTAVYLASKPLYHELHKKGFLVKELTPNIRYSLQKYLNRMCYRPTPFGLFSGFSLAQWDAVGKLPLLLSGGAAKLLATLSFKDGLKLAGELLNHELAPFHTYRKNQSFYKVQDEYRYLRYEKDDERGRRHFMVDSLGYQSFLNSILQYCKSERKQEAVVAFIIEQASATKEEAEAFFEQLVEQQIIVSTLEPNITGQDYLERLSALCRSLHLHTPRSNNITSVMEKLKAIAQGGDIHRTCSIIPALEQEVPSSGKAVSALYANLDKGAATGGLSESYQESILEGITCIEKLVSYSKPQGLQNFTIAFKKKFENRSIPLLRALDPELGVGYEDLAGSHRTPKLLQDIEFPTGGKESPTIIWTAAHALLMEKWGGAKGPKAVLELTEADLNKMGSGDDTSCLSPSISVLFRVVGDSVYIEQAGGASATALLGRFTPLHPDIDRMSRAVAQYEEAANPDVIFAEIAHLSDEHTANIDRRNAIRRFEIPVLVQSSVCEEKQIELSDLWVRVEGDHIVLFSRKLRKVIVPRLGSAFNYIRNDLSVFRFLCDMQYQGIKANFTLDLSHFFPGMSFYPRVKYKSAILHLATWHLQKEQLITITQAAAEKGLTLLQELARRLGWPRYIALTEHDNQLVFDVEREADTALFLHSIRQKEKVTVREFPFVEEQRPVVVDHEAKPYTHQFLAALYHEEEVYPKHEFKINDLRARAGKERKLLPGSEWLYFKLYCHPSRSNELLSEVLLPAISLLQRKGEVRQWFYVRYRDPDYHIRVRLSVSPENTGKVLGFIRVKLSGLVRKGTVEDLQLAVYERELERYGPELIEAAEDVFCASSALIAASIRKQALDESDYGYYKDAFSGLHEIADVFKLDLEERVQLFHQLYQGFYMEFGGDKALREQLSMKFRNLNRLTAILPHHRPKGKQQEQSLKKLQSRHRETLNVLAQQIGPASVPRHLVADLMHMHLNRLFVDQARKQEMVVYYCLWKSYTAALAQSRR